MKAIFPRSVSLTAFVVSQVLIDIESGYHLVRGDWPVHREAHSLVIATVIGLASGVGVWVVGSLFKTESKQLTVRAETNRIPALIGGVLGGASHPVLDGVMHSDLRPFWPFSSANPFFETLDLGMLHALCVVTGAAGVLILTARERFRARGEPPSP